MLKAQTTIATCLSAIILVTCICINASAQQDSIPIQKPVSDTTQMNANNNESMKETKASGKDSSKTIYRFHISAGAFFPLVSTRLRLDTKDGSVGTDISLEETFGLTQNPSVFKIEGIYQLSKRSAFKGTFFNMNRQKTWIIDRDIKIADSTYHVGADIDFYFNTSYFALNYRYSILAKRDWQMGVSFGLRWLDFRTGLKVVSDSINKEANYQIGVPAVLFGLSVSGNILPKLVGRYDFEVFKLSIEGIDAMVYENRLSLEYYIFKNIGIGGAFNGVLYMARDLPLSRNFNGEIRYVLNGLSAFAAVRF